MLKARESDVKPAANASNEALNEVNLLIGWCGPLTQK